MTTLTNIRFHMVTDRSVAHEKPCVLGRIAMGAVFLGIAVQYAKLNGWL